MFWERETLKEVFLRRKNIEKWKGRGHCFGVDERMEKKKTKTYRRKKKD